MHVAIVIHEQASIPPLAEAEVLGKLVEDLAVFVLPCTEAEMKRFDLAKEDPIPEHWLIGIAHDKFSAKAASERLKVLSEIVDVRVDLGRFD